MEGKEPRGKERKVLGRVKRYVRRSSLLHRGSPHEHPDHTPPAEDAGPGFDTLPAEVCHY
jgi:hypothetical protein